MLSSQVKISRLLWHKLCLLWLKIVKVKFRLCLCNKIENYMAIRTCIKNFFSGVENFISQCGYVISSISILFP